MINFVNMAGFLTLLLEGVAHKTAPPLSSPLTANLQEMEKSENHVQIDQPEIQQGVKWCSICCSVGRVCDVALLRS